ncbi:MAG: aldolase/citrate lyase family protein [Turneriella sp.]|nr:aldolase/citrate lyase family protein [Turneriella sp.]
MRTEWLKRLSETLQHLKERHSVVALKTGTEVEDMDAAEIAFLRELSAAVGLPLIVKIGGPEARRDMRECLALGVDVLLAPMVESVYALLNFTDSAQEIMQKTGKKARLAINLETQQAVQQLDAMIASRGFAALSQVTIGRADLSRSMNLGVDDEEVLAVTRTALAKINRQKKISSVGGGLSVHNIGMIAELLPATRFNTRHTVFENSEVFSRNATQNLAQGLCFEQQLYGALSELFPQRAEFYAERIQQLEERLPVLRLRRSAVS